MQSEENLVEIYSLIKSCLLRRKCTICNGEVKGRKIKINIVRC